MTFYLRDEYFGTIVDLEFWTKIEYDSDDQLHKFHEISSQINILNYSKFLLNQKKQKQLLTIYHINELSELRGWLWESYYMRKKNIGSDDDYGKIVENLNHFFSHAAKELNLLFVID